MAEGGGKVKAKVEEIAAAVQEKLPGIQVTFHGNVIFEGEYGAIFSAKKPFWYNTVTLYAYGEGIIATVFSGILSHRVVPRHMDAMTFEDQVAFVVEALSDPGALE